MVKILSQDETLETKGGRGWCSYWENDRFGAGHWMENLFSRTRKEAWDKFLEFLQSAPSTPQERRAAIAQIRRCGGRVTRVRLIKAYREYDLEYDGFFVTQTDYDAARAEIETLQQQNDELKTLVEKQRIDLACPGAIYGGSWVNLSPRQE